jgi:2-hydroxycyclohexanecarboxyl-CoA dehydrogenase
MTARGRVALVAGGGAGIGRAIAGHLARDGFKVGVLDIDSDAADQAAKPIDGLGGVALGYRADVSDRPQVDAAVAAARAELGPLCVVIANAGVARCSPSWR